MISFITFFGGFVSGKQKVHYLFWALHVSKTGVSLPILGTSLHEPKKCLTGMK